MEMKLCMLQRVDKRECVNKIAMNLEVGQTINISYFITEMTEAFTAGVMIFIEARWPWSIGVLES